MGDKSKIEWTEATYNPIRARNIETGGVGHYCEKVSDGCSRCYAERMQPRFKNPIRYNAADKKLVELFLDEEVLTQPLRWKRPRRIFVGSMTDIYGEWVPDEWLHKIKAIEALASWHTFEELTKRPDRMLDYITSDAYHRTQDVAAKVGWLTKGLGFRYSAWTWPLHNVWPGVSIEDQKNADVRREYLRKMSDLGRTTFVSYEPALGPVDWTGWEFVDQIISGGESGSKARPSHPDWHRAARDFCQANGIAYFFKQWGEFGPNVLGINDAYPYERLGKKKAGRRLDGREWNEMPEVTNAASLTVCYGRIGRSRKSNSRNPLLSFGLKKRVKPVSRLPFLKRTAARGEIKHARRSRAFWSSKSQPNQQSQ